jgi:NADH-quinone oxidoreductase subunit L
MMIGAATLTTIIGWCYVYMKAHGRSLPLPAWINIIRIRLYVLFLNRLYVDECFHRLGFVRRSALQWFESRAQERLS